MDSLEKDYLNYKKILWYMKSMKKMIKKLNKAVFHLIQCKLKNKQIKVYNFRSNAIKKFT